MEFMVGTDGQKGHMLLKIPTNLPDSSFSRVLPQDPVQALRLSRPGSSTSYMQANDRM
jgi:hypothetical protein